MKRLCSTLNFIAAPFFPYNTRETHTKTDRHTQTEKESFLKNSNCILLLDKLHSNHFKSCILWQSKLCWKSGLFNFNQDVLLPDQPIKNLWKDCVCVCVCVCVCLRNLWGGQQLQMLCTVTQLWTLRLKHVNRRSELFPLNILAAAVWYLQRILN